MREILLTKGKVALVDDADYAELSRHKWFADESGRTFYALRMVRKSKGKQGKVRMHRVITGAEIGQEVDHINMNGLDNRRENLRLCSPAENRYNRVKRPDNVSGYKGVAWQKDCQKWVAYISGEKQRYLGLFENALVAALAYDAAARIQYGEFARLNFPGPGERAA